jgi:hypothetical protein
MTCEIEGLEVTSKHLKHFLQKRTISGADIFWGVFSRLLVKLYEKGESPANWSDKNWQEFKEIIISDLKKQTVSIHETNSKALDKNQRKVSRAGLNHQFNEAKIELNLLYSSAKRVPENGRQAYWDGILWWAKSVVDQPLSGIAATSTVWQIPSSKDLQAIREYALHADWVRTSSQELLVKLGNTVARGEFKEDPLLSNYPIADISGREWQAHAEIKPLAYELEIGGMTVPSDKLQSAMHQIASDLKKRGIEVDEASKIVLSLWDETRDREGWAYVTLDDICRKMGIRERANHGGFEPRKRDAIRMAVDKAARISITIRDLPRMKDINSSKVKGEDPFLLIKNRFSAQGELWSPNSSSMWDAITVQPGSVTRHAIEEYGRLSMLLPKKVLALDSHRFRNVKLLAGRLSQIFRIRAKDGEKSHHLTVDCLVEYADLQKNAETKDKLEQVLDKLVETSAIASWQYKEGFNIDDLVKERVTKRILEKYWNCFVELEVPSAVVEEYASIALNYSGHTKPKALPKPNGIAEELKQARKLENLSLDELASIAGVSKPTLSRIENGKPVGGKTLSKVQSWLSGRQQ